jgi:hypothetical protein
MTFEEDSEAFRRLGYHPARTERQMRIYETNRELFISLYNYIDKLGQTSREKSIALTHLQDALMWTNAHVACNNVGAEDAGQS